MGIGVNVNLLPEQIPAWLIDRAISLAMATGRDWSIPEVGAAVLARMEDSYRRFITGGFDALRQEWIAGSETIGRLVTVTTASGDLTGLAETVDSHGRLVLQLEDGRTQYVASGDVALAGNATGGVTHSTRP
jgi:BirA family biotin operon repressor/biotin-[acetyl-CoA-carboxylase] ligase